MTELRHTAKEFAEGNSLKNNFYYRTKLAGKDWEQLSVRKPEPNIASRIFVFKQTEVTRFYKNLVDVFGVYKFGPNRIFNVDKSGFSIGQKPSPVL